MPDNQNLDTLNLIFSRIREVLSTLQIQTTRSNLDVTLGCMHWVKNAPLRLLR